MAADHLIRALVAFPKLRFYFPDIATTADRGLVLTHEAASALWLIEAFTKTQGFASQAQVRTILGMPQDRFSQILRPLLKDCVISDRDPGDGRNRRLAITKHGHTVLAAIGSEYETLIEERFADLQRSQRRACILALNEIATPACRLLGQKHLDVKR